MNIVVIDGKTEDFPNLSEWDFSDFIVWLRDAMLPDGLVFTAFSKYWRVVGDCVTDGYDCYCAPAFAVYRKGLGVTQDDETKGKILAYISTHHDLRYRTIARDIGISSACVGYHISDLESRGIVETDPICLTEIGEQSLAYIQDFTTDVTDDRDCQPL